MDIPDGVRWVDRLEKMKRFIEVRRCPFGLMGWRGRFVEWWLVWGRSVFFVCGARI